MALGRRQFLSWLIRLDFERLSPDFPIYSGREWWRKGELSVCVDAPGKVRGETGCITIFYGKSGPVFQTNAEAGLLAICKHLGFDAAQDNESGKVPVRGLSRRLAEIRDGDAKRLRKEVKGNRWQGKTRRGVEIREGARRRDRVARPAVYKGAV